MKFKWKVLTLSIFFSLFLAVGNLSLPTNVAATETFSGSITSKVNESSSSIYTDKSKKTLFGFTKNIQDIVLVVVIAYLMIGGLITTVKFTNVDDANKKAELKRTLIYYVVGLAFISSYVGIVKIFLQIKL